MRNQIIGAVILEVTKLAGHYFRSKPITKESSFALSAEPAPHKTYYIKESPEKAPEPEPALIRQSPVATDEPEIDPEKATAIATGCIPCAIGHLGTCSGLLNEAMRFAGSGGMVSDEVIDRVGMCLNELNAMERQDLRPEMVINLPVWEKKLVDKVLLASRETRHKLEAMESVESLEQCAATTQGTHKGIWRDYIKNKAANLTPEEVASNWEAIQGRLLAKIEEITSEEEEGEEE